MTSDASLLTIDKLAVRYGPVEAIRDLTLTVEQGEIVTVVGSNGAGKSTLLHAVSGLVASSGEVSLDGRDITDLPGFQRARQGIALVPEGRMIFGELSVLDNLRTGIASMSARSRAERLEPIFELFPVLRDRSRQVGATLSGGEQQMLAIGRALVTKPRILLMDEPSMGLAPKIVDDVYEVLHLLREAGQTVLLVEQNARKAFSVADRGYVLEVGEIVMEGPAADLAADDQVRRAYLGV